ncbi:MAG TPA: efflux RND transporter periplasmic adaptor subunit [Ignavibacteria bacterium]|nr:efflux RND transporter periplasmic adaptor subunit [Ignavibacteria bacterium]
MNIIKNKLSKVLSISVLISFNMILILAMQGCNSNENNSSEKVDDHENHEDENAGHKDEVSLTEDQIRVMDIKFSKFEPRNINGYIKVNGEIMMDQDNESRVGSLISGRVKKIFVKEGSYVRAGQTLAVIENPDLINVQVDYINAKNEYEYSKQEYDRQRKLSSDNIGSKKNFAEIETNYKRALANYRSLEEKLSGYKISKNRFDNIYTDTTADLQRNYSVTAPISGNIVARMVTIGQYIEPSVDMFQIVNTSTVYVDLSIFEKDLGNVKVGQKVVIETGSKPDENYEGKVSFINKIFNDRDRTVKVRVVINNRSQELYPYMFVSAKIYVTGGEALSVPVSSIETEGEINYIFLKTGERKVIDEHDEHEKDNEHEHSDGEKEHTESDHSNEGHTEESGIVFKKVIVNTGITDGAFVEIIPVSEMNLGDEVVSKGTFYLKSELSKGELGEHNH